MKKIDMPQVHQVLLGIAKEFAVICERHDIPYFMLGGTMIGAIRHKGFIPWDDDMDFGVPREHYPKLLDVLEKELHEPYKSHYFETDNRLHSAWIKIDDTTTVIDDPCAIMPLEEQLGVNIDVFPMDYSDDSEKTIAKKILRLVKLQVLLFVDDNKRRKSHNVIKHIVRCFVPFSKKFLVRKMERTLCNLQGRKYLGVFYGLGGERDICVPVEWYGNQYFEFENTKFRGVAEYDKYLTQRYGDYMKMPPKEKQETHCENIYIKD